MVCKSKELEAPNCSNKCFQTETFKSKHQSARWLRKFDQVLSKCSMLDFLTLNDDQNQSFQTPLIDSLKSLIKHECHEKYSHRSKNFLLALEYLEQSCFSTVEFSFSWLIFQLFLVDSILDFEQKFLRAWLMIDRIAFSILKKIIVTIELTF